MFRVCLPLAVPLPSLCPRPAPLLTLQHKVNHEAVLDWGIPERCDWRSQGMVTHAEPAGVGMGKGASVHVPEPRFVGDNPNSQHLRVETPHPGVWVLQAEGAPWDRACFRVDIMSKCLVRAPHPHLLLVAIKGQIELPMDFKPSVAWRAANPSAAALCHTCCALGRITSIDSFQGLGCTEGWAPVSCMDRSNPALHSFHLLILLGKVLLFLRLPSLKCPWGTAGCKINPSEHFGWTLFPAGSTARGWSRSPWLPVGVCVPSGVCPVLPCSGAVGNEVEQPGNKGAAGCRVWSQVLQPPGRTPNNEAFAASKKTPQSFQAAHGKSVKQLR